MTSGGLRRRALATALSMLIVGRMMNLLDSRMLVIFGMIIFGISTWWMGGLTQDAGYWDVFWPRVIQGLALGFMFVPLTTVTLGAVPKEELAGATGVSALIRQLGGSFGIAILTTLLARQTAVAWSELASGVTNAHGYSIPILTSLVAQQSAVNAYDYLFRLSAIIFFVCAPLVIFMRPSRRAAAAAAAMAAE